MFESSLFPLALYRKRRKWKKGLLRRDYLGYESLYGLWEKTDAEEEKSTSSQSGVSFADLPIQRLNSPSSFSPYEAELPDDL
jgi:hypothetical protein